MTKQEKQHKYMKGLKGYIVKEFTLVKEGEDEDGVGYLFIMDENFFYIYEEKNEVYIKHLGPVDKKYYNQLDCLHLLLEKEYTGCKKGEIEMKKKGEWYDLKIYK